MNDTTHKTFIIVAGQLTYDKDIINCYDKSPNVIISTLDNDASKIDELKKHFTVSLLPFDFNPGTGNLNCQTRTTIKGLQIAKEMGATHALKVRSDMTISNISGLLAILEKKSRLSFLAWHSHGYLVDYINYGPIDSMIEWWDVFEVNINFAERNLMNHFSAVKKEPLTTFSDITRHVDFFLEDLVEKNIRIYWLKYGLELSDYRKYPCYMYKSYD